MDSSGRTLGHVRDLTVRLELNRYAVQRALVNRGRRHAYLPWASLDRPETGEGAKVPWTLTTGGHGADDEDLRPDELLLRRDVLDVQIIDLAGRRLTRVSDVLLDEAQSGALTVKAVDVGARALVRRLGWPSRGSSSSGDLVPFDQLHLTSERGHAMQLASASPPIAQTSHEELSAALSGLDLRKASDVVQSVGTRRAAAALLIADHDVASNLLTMLPEEHVAEIRGHLPAGAQHTHPHLYVTDRRSPRRFRRFAGWKRRMPRRRNNTT